MNKKLLLYCLIIFLSSCSQSEPNYNNQEVESNKNSTQVQIPTEQNKQVLDFVIQDLNQNLMNNPEFKEAVSKLTENEAKLLSEYFNEYQSNSVYGDIVKASRMFPISIKDAIKAEKKIIAERGGTIEEVAVQEMQNIEKMKSENDKAIQKLKAEMEKN